MKRPAVRAATLAVAVVGLLVAPLFLSNYGWFILATAMVYALVALSLNILVGMAGQISIGHAGFWALGAYASAIAMQNFGVPFVLALLLGGAVAGVFGAVVALPALRVSGHYLAIATLAFAILVQQVLFEWESVTGGRQGLAVPRPSLGMELTSDFSYYYFLLALFLASAWVVRNLRNSLTGRSLMALKQSAVAAQCAGISRARHIILAFALSAFFTGVSGALYGSLIGRLSTETFSLTASLSFLTMAVIGGLGSEAGALLGAAFLALAPEVLRQFKDAEMVVYGVILVLCMIFLPNGLVSIWRWKK
jgi:branched-chain amino acid transport system permease protein